MSYFRTCPYCGDNLDPGEICGCRRPESKSKENEKANKSKKPVYIVISNGQAKVCKG